jgi:hypothetical protein
VELGLIIFVLGLAGYVASLIYLNSRVRLTRSKHYEFPETDPKALSYLASIGWRLWLTVAFLFLSVLVIAIIFANELFPR